MGCVWWNCEKNDSVVFCLVEGIDRTMTLVIVHDDEVFPISVGLNMTNKMLEEFYKTVARHPSTRMSSCIAARRGMIEEPILPVFSGEYHVWRDVAPGSVDTGTNGNQLTSFGRCHFSYLFGTLNCNNFAKLIASYLSGNYSAFYKELCLFF